MRRLVLDNSASTIDLDAIEVLVVLDSTRIDYASVTDPLTDLRFEDGVTAANVPFDVETWNPAGESLVWIRVENVAAGSTDHAVLLHAGADANGTADPAATWADWDLVQHFTPGLANSASASYAGTAINTTLGPGKIGEAAVFTGTGDERITFANGDALLDGWNAFTLMLWLSVDYAGVGDLNGEPVVMDQGGSVTGGRLIPPSGDVEFQLDVHFQTSTGYLNTQLAQNTWKLVTYTSDGMTLRMWGDTASEGTHSTNNKPLEPSTGAFRLGSSTNPFIGSVDELRIAKSSLVLDQVRAHHRIMQRQFVTFVAP